MTTSDDPFATKVNSEASGLSPKSTDLRFPSIPGYSIEEVLGQGGMGRVYLGRDLQLGRLVAIKCLVDTSNPQLLRRFEEEAKSVSRLRHPNIAQLYGFQSQSEPAFLVMELVPGGTLADFIQKRPLEGNLAAKILATIARAIGYAHQNDIVHRDLKPSNILIGGEKLHAGERESKEFDVSRIRIADFGLAKKISGDANLTRTGDIVGTANYMSPEQATGVVSRIGPATDIYSMGAILYELLTGRPPFVAPDSVQTLMMLLTEEPVLPRTLVGRVPLDLQTICMKCLEKKPSRRYSSAIELADDLDRYCRNEPIQARPISILHRSLKWAKRRPWQAAAIGLLSLSAIGSSIGFVTIRRAQQETKQANLELVNANASLVTAKKGTEEALDLTHLALAKIVNRVRDELVDIPRAIELRLQTAKDSVTLNRELLRLRPRNFDTMQELAKSLEFYRLSEWLSGDRERSNELFEELSQHLDECCSLFPEDVYFVTERIKLKMESVGSLESSEQSKAEMEIQSQLDRIVRLHPDDPWVHRVASTVANHWVDNAVVLGDVEAVYRHAKERVEHSRKYLQFSGEYTKADAAKWLIKALAFLSTVQMKLRDFESMQSTIDETQATMDSIDWDLADPMFLSTSARLHELRGNLALNTNDATLAVEEYRKGVEVLTELDREFPDEIATESSLAQLVLQLALVLFRTDNLQESRTLIQKAETTIQSALRKRPEDYLANHIKEQIGQLKGLLEEK